MRKITKCVSGLYVFAPEGLNIRISVEEFYFAEKKEKLRCSLGGVAILYPSDNLMIEYEEYEVICVPSSPHYLHEPIYLVQNTALVIIYWYEEYGNLSAIFSVTTTSCTPVVVFPCLGSSQGRENLVLGSPGHPVQFLKDELFLFDLKPNTCVVVLVLPSLKENINFLQMTDNDILHPICKSQILTHIHIQEKGAVVEFAVEGYLTSK